MSLLLHKPSQDNASSNKNTKEPISRSLIGSLSKDYGVVLRKTTGKWISLTTFSFAAIKNDFLPLIFLPTKLSQFHHLYLPPTSPKNI